MGFFGNLFTDGDAKRTAYDNASKKKQLYDELQMPDLEWTDYDPEVLELLSSDFSLVTEDPENLALQNQALAQMAQMADTGYTDVDLAQRENAKDMANQRARQASLAALQNAQARGVAGSGMEFGLREMANQAESERARKQAMDSAAQNARQRALAQQAYASQLGQQRGQNYQAKAGNADIINRFNQMNTQNRNQAAQYNVGQRNAAQQYNNQGRLGLQQQNYDNRLGQAGLRAGVLDQRARADIAQSQANAAAIDSFAGMAMMGMGAYGGQKPQGQQGSTGNMGGGGSMSTSGAQRPYNYMIP